MEQNFVKKEIKAIDRWVNYVVTHTWIKTGVFVVAMLEATISPVLPEIIVASILAYRKDISWKLLSCISAAGSATGVTLLYIAGKYLYTSYQVFFDKIFSGELIAHYTDQIVHQNTFITMFVASFTPLPDRVFAFLGGLLSAPFLVVLVAFFLGRLLRVGIVAYFSFHFGKEAKDYIIKNTKKATLIIAGLVLLYIIFKMSGIL